MRKRTLATALSVLLLSSACGGDPAAVTVGHSIVLVDLLPAGGGFDPDGFEVRVNDVIQSRRVDFEVPREISVRAEGVLTIDLDDIADNCANRSGPIRLLPGSGPRHRATFIVSCAAPPDLDARELVIESRDSLRRVVAGHIYDEGDDAILRLGPGRRPAVSMDGARVAFLVGGLPYVANADGTDRRPVAGEADFPLSLDHLGWSRDGERLLVSGPENWWSGGPVGTVRLADDTVTWLMTALGDSVFGYEATWSPAEDRIALGVRWTWDPGLYTVDVTGEGPTQVADFGRTPVWSPDGEALAFTREDTDLVLARLGEWGTTLLSSSPTGGMRRISDWSSDGEFLLYTDRVSGMTDASTDLFALRLSDGATYRLTVTGNVSGGAFLDGGL